MNAKYVGFVHDAFEFTQKNQLVDCALWERFVRQFAEHSDNDGGWRGEYWGKMMRGASLVYSYTKNRVLYSVMTKTVSDMMNTMDELGRISTYDTKHEFDAWDLWCRKYVVLGMEYYLEVCEDESFKKDIIKSMCKQVDYIMSKIGSADEGKKEITLATRHWRGANSASILEPVVKLYNITGDKKYFEFAKYIVDTGATDVENLFELAYQDKIPLYLYPVTKAYEITSCFEGLIEFYKITGEEKYKTSIVNYANKILENEMSVIGCCGCTHELFDHTKVRQANTTNGNIMQETCVTVTLMKFFYRVFLLTYDVKFADAFEISFYNAYLGAFNTDCVIEPMIKKEYPQCVHEPMPFDSYSPLTAGTRGNGIGGFKIMSDNHYYGCCACIGSAGMGMVPYMHAVKYDKGIIMNLYINGSIDCVTPLGNTVTFKTDTQYPKSGSVKITVHTSVSEQFEIALRNPLWSKDTKISVNGKVCNVCDGYVRLFENWNDGDVIQIEFDMRTKVIRPVPYGSQIIMNKVIWGHNYMVSTYDEEDPVAHKHIALQRGPVMLAAENRLGYSVDEEFDIKINEDGYADVVISDSEFPYNCIVKAEVASNNGSYIKMTDYASAGKLWTEQSKVAVWMRNK